MTPADIDPKVLTQRAAWILEMIGALRDLPLKNKGEFLQNRHTVAAAAWGALSLVAAGSSRSRFTGFAPASGQSLCRLPHGR